MISLPPSIRVLIHCIICKRHLRCDGVWCTRCPGYLHVSFSRLTTGNDYYCQGISCKKSSAEKKATEDQTAVPNYLSDLRFWASQTDKTRKLIEVYNEVIHLKPVFLILGKDKAGYNFVKQLNKLLQSLADGTSLV